jgi:hypothetical protein
MILKRIKYPQALALAKRNTAKQGCLATHCSLTWASRRSSSPHANSGSRTHSPITKRWAHLWKAADAFPAEAPRDVGIEVHIAAGSPAVGSDGRRVGTVTTQTSR